jgi:hypothetical protein
MRRQNILLGVQAAKRGFTLLPSPFPQTLNRQGSCDSHRHSAATLNAQTQCLEATAAGLG